jgi:hypothetical protein
MYAILTEHWARGLDADDYTRTTCRRMMWRLRMHRQTPSLDEALKIARKCTIKKIEVRLWPAGQGWHQGEYLLSLAETPGKLIWYRDEQGEHPYAHSILTPPLQSKWRVRR